MFGSLNKHMRVLWIILNSSLVVFFFFIIIVITIELCFLLVVRCCLHFFAFNAHYFGSIYQCIAKYVVVAFYCCYSSTFFVQAKTCRHILFYFAFLSLYSISVCRPLFVICIWNAIELHHILLLFLIKKKRNKKHIGWKTSNKTSSSIPIAVHFSYTIVVDSTKKKEIKS